MKEGREAVSGMWKEVSGAWDRGCLGRGRGDVWGVGEGLGCGAGSV